MRTSPGHRPGQPANVRVPDPGRRPARAVRARVPDSPYSYRYLLPALAEAGHRAVARSTAGSRRPSFPMTATTCTPARWSPTRSRSTSTVPQSLRCLTRSHASNPALVAGPVVRCLVTAERRQV